MSKPFIDGNVILYLLSNNVAKADKSEAIVGAGGTISVQVLNEVTAVCHRKLNLDWLEIEAVLQAIKASLEVVPLTEQTHTKAVEIAQRYQRSFYEALFFASGITAGAPDLLSEGMQHGMHVDGLVIQNPF